MGTPVTGTVGSGTTLTSSIPVLIGGVDANGVARTLVLNSDGSLPSTALADALATSQGLLTQNFDRSLLANAFTLTGGTAYATLVPVRAGAVIGNAYVQCSTAGSSTTLFKAGLYSLDGTTQYGLTTDKSASFGTSGVKTLALSAAWTVPAGVSAAYMVVVSTAGTTLPSLSRNQQASAETQIGASPRPYATCGTGLADLPAVPLTFSATNGTAFWAGLGT